MKNIKKIMILGSILGASSSFGMMQRLPKILKQSDEQALSQQELNNLSRMAKNSQSIPPVKKKIEYILDLDTPRQDQVALAEVLINWLKPFPPYDQYLKRLQLSKKGIADDSKMPPAAKAPAAPDVPPAPPAPPVKRVPVTVPPITPKALKDAKEKLKKFETDIKKIDKKVSEFKDASYEEFSEMEDDISDDIKKIKLELSPTKDAIRELPAKERADLNEEVKNLEGLIGGVTKKKAQATIKQVEQAQKAVAQKIDAVKKQTVQLEKVNVEPEYKKVTAEAEVKINDIDKLLKELEKDLDKLSKEQEVEKLMQDNVKRLSAALEDLKKKGKQAGAQFKIAKIESVADPIAQRFEVEKQDVKREIQEEKIDAKALQGELKEAEEAYEELRKKREQDLKAIEEIESELAEIEAKRRAEQARKNTRDSLKRATEDLEKLQEQVKGKTGEEGGEQALKTAIKNSMLQSTELLGKVTKTIGDRNLAAIQKEFVAISNVMKEGDAALNKLQKLISADKLDEFIESLESEAGGLAKAAFGVGDAIKKAWTPYIVSLEKGGKTDQAIQEIKVIANIVKNLYGLLAVYDIEETQKQFNEFVSEIEEARVKAQVEELQRIIQNRFRGEVALIKTLHPLPADLESPELRQALAEIAEISKKNSEDLNKLAQLIGQDEVVQFITGPSEELSQETRRIGERLKKRLASEVVALENESKSAEAQSKQEKGVNFLRNLYKSTIFNPEEVLQEFISEIEQLRRESKVEISEASDYKKLAELADQILAVNTKEELLQIIGDNEALFLRRAGLDHTNSLKRIQKRLLFIYHPDKVKNIYEKYGILEYNNEKAEKMARHLEDLIASD